MLKMAEERPNIRIEIQNNLVEAMDVDEEQKESGCEEGEISDTNELEENTQKITPVEDSRRIWPNQAGGFATGINIFDKEEQGKLQERAKRFGLKPTEIHNFSDEQLQELHDSLGITVEGEKDVRFEALHVHGTDEMSNENVLEYFGKYGPAGVEWINDECCNVIWSDKVSAARALFYLSSPIQGMPVEGSCDPFSKDLEFNDLESVKEEEEGSRSILLKNNNREVELEKEDKDGYGDKVHVSDITVPVPPGYWRLGTKYHKAKFILLRFALKSDKKPFRAERFSEYYKKYGNPNFGGMRGIITETRRQKTKGIFDRNREISGHTDADDNKNPWGALAENWEEDENFAEKVAKPQEIVKSTSNSNIMNRLGFKRSIEEKEIVEESDECPEKKSKVPRMRMYADEEEEKIKRKKQLMAIKKIQNVDVDSKRSIDLRSVLNIPKRDNEITIKEESSTIDLGHKLKHRIRKTRDNYEGRLEMEDAREKSKLRNDEHPRGRNLKSRMEIEPRARRERSPKYESKMHSDKQEHRRHNSYHEDEFVTTKPKSKVAIVIKSQKKPSVASTVWSRINNESDRLKTVAEGKLRVRRNSSTNSESSSETSSTTSDNSSESESDIPKEKGNLKLNRPGFKRDLSERLGIIKKEHKSPLRIEINNDHFKQ